jgi:hypothetical protein
VVVEYFATNSTPIKKPEVFALIASKVTDAAPNEADYNRIMKELATYNGIESLVLFCCCNFALNSIFA